MSELLCTKEFDTSKIKESDYPTDFIPAGAEIIVGVDHSDIGDCMVKGFYDPKTGSYHIQQVVHNVWQ